MTSAVAGTPENAWGIDLGPQPLHGRAGLFVGLPGRLREGEHGQITGRAGRAGDGALEGGVGLDGGGEGGHRLLHRRIGGRAVHGYLDVGHQGRREVRGQDVEGLPRFLVGRKGVDPDGSLVQLQVEAARHQEYETGNGQADDRTGHHAVGDPVPEAGLSGVSVVAGALEEGHAEAVHPVAEEAEQGGQQREGGEDGAQYREHRAQGHAVEDAHGHEQQTAESHDDRAPAEEHGPAGRPAGAGDGIELGPARAPLFPVARDDEERVVDAHRQTDHGDHVGDEGAELEELPGDGGHAHGDHDGDHGQQEGDAGGHERSEHEHEDDQGHPDAEHLAALQVALADLGEISVDAGPAGDEHLEAVPLARLLDGRRQCVDVLLDLALAAGHRHGYDRGVTVTGDQRRVGHHGVGGAPLDHVGSERDGRGQHVVGALLEDGVVHGALRRLQHDEFVDGVLGVEARVDQFVCPIGLGVVGRGAYRW